MSSKLRMALGALGSLVLSTLSPRAEDSAWVSIIPKTAELENWTVKFTGKPVGQNPDTTFRLSPEGYLWADNHTNFSRTGFGHLYYTKRKLSYYMVRAEYHFTAEKSAPNFATWTTQNNGLMIHSPEPATVNGEFPNSIEVQLLGPKNSNESGVVPSATWPVGKTANMCIAGDAFFVSYNGNASYTSHCTPATYPDAWKGTRTPWEGEWSDVTVRVLSDSLLQNFIRGQKVFELSKIRNKASGAAVKEGYLAIQAEGTPTLFRKLEILDLTGCMDKSKTAYRTYFVKNDAAACAVTSASPREPARGHALVRDGSGLRVDGPGARIASVRKADGSLLEEFPLTGAPVTRYLPRMPGIYLVSVAISSGAMTTAKVPFF